MKSIAIISISIVAALHASISFGQAGTCPPNIDFENGNFINWYCYTGKVTTSAGVNTINWFNNNPPVNSPVNGRHKMLTSTTPSQLDPYGGFPINPPNGSGH